jgi:predicted Rossmann fold nucleotide-binding protein DprA/Smf involved in DNA uptake
MLPEGNSQAILLLAAHFSNPTSGEPTPLTATEYGKLSVWLREKDYQPADLLTRFEEVKKEWVAPGSKITLERIEYLLGRGMAMGVALDKWNSACIWMITRADADYPSRLKKKLGNQAPPILFGVGEKRLLEKGGLAIVGSREVATDDQGYARQLARSASNAGMNVVSGGARGVDEVSMLAALEVEGTALGVLANGLLSAALSGKWKLHIRRKGLCLTSPYYPEAPFHVGNAMGRNKYIYCLASYGLVVRSDKGKGGTWAGATEALKKSLAPVFVKPDSDAAGNAALIDLGAVPLPAPAISAAEDPDWLTRALGESGAAEPTMLARPDGAVGDGVEVTTVAEPSSESPVRGEPPGPQEHKRLTREPTPSHFYDYFVEQLTHCLATRQKISLKELKERHPDLAPKQLTDWLHRAVDEGQIERPGKAHVYTLEAAKGGQPDLFDEKKGSRL